MKYLSFLAFFLPLLSTAQIDITAIQKEYDSLMNTTIYGRNENAGKYYDIRGFKMYCEVYGSGEPLLLIHGGGGSINNFVKQIPFFSRKYKVIVADSRGHGKSIDKVDSLTYEMMADDYAALLTKMGIDSACLIGWSDGGIIGLLLSIRHPEKIKKLVITGANLEPDTAAISPDVYKRIYETYTYLKTKQNKNDLDKKVLKYFRLLVEQPHISLSDLKKIKIPTLVIGGDHDAILPGHTLQIFSNINNAYLWILPGAGHSTLVVYPEEFNVKTDLFIKSPFRRIEDRDRYF